MWLLWAPSSWAVGLLAVTLWRRRAEVSVADTLQRPETWSCWHWAANLRPGPHTPTWWPGPGGAPASPAPRAATRRSVSRMGPFPSRNYFWGELGLSGPGAGSGGDRRWGFSERKISLVSPNSLDPNPIFSPFFFFFFQMLIFFSPVPLLFSCLGFENTPFLQGPLSDRFPGSLPFPPRA